MDLIKFMLDYFWWYATLILLIIIFERRNYIESKSKTNESSIKDKEKELLSKIVILYYKVLHPGRRFTVCLKFLKNNKYVHVVVSFHGSETFIYEYYNVQKHRTNVLTYLLEEEKELLKSILRKHIEGCEKYYFNKRRNEFI